MKVLLQGIAGKLFIINSLTSIAYAFILPIMSVYLVDGLGASPSFIASYNICFALSGILCSQWFGSLSDKGVSDRLLFLNSMLCIVVAAACFIFVTKPWQALVVGLILMGPGHACIPLLLSMIKRYASQAGKNITSLNVQMRTGVSAVWIIGPTLAFIVADIWGYIANFYITCILATLVVILSAKYLPTLNKVCKTPPPSKTQQSRITTLAGLLGFVVLLGSLANNVYLTVVA